MAKTNAFDTMVAFCDISCPQAEGYSLDDVDKDIGECHNMLQWAMSELDFNPESERWKEEVAFWRRMLQEAKRAKVRMCQGVNNIQRGMLTA